ncbi:MAG: hypothetical protein CVV25_11790 [Ignavibacteriae bacterium HGW-Ignavibacteriae-4]|jgi:hypothetical protein|nr:MAG: hypothetical protein CVV25_11790 [Ignavibacteriae bacterium HGW-Ignavibacteriae-4]
MKQTIYKLLLLGFIAAFMSAGSIDLLAKGPATPIKVGIKVDIKESSPVQGNITLTWVDGDRNNDLGNYFRINQYKKVDGKETEERVAEVERTSKGEYKFVIENLAVADYCYTLDLYDEKNDVASDLTERVCGKIAENTPPKERMSFLEDQALIKLDADGLGRYAAKIFNNTNCEFDIKIIETDVKIEVAEQGSNAVVFKIQAEEKGKYLAVVGLVNNCTGEITSKLVLDICNGDCNPNEPRIYFEKETQFSHKLEAGVAWKYDINAVSKDDCRLTYYLSDDTGGHNTTPEGLRLDEETGMMTWEKPVKGTYTVPVIVKSTCDGGVTFTQITGYFNLFVNGEEPKPTSVLICNFSDETDDVKDFFGKVTVWSADQKDPGVPPTNDRKTFTAELNGTSVSFKLPTGKYYLRADVKGYKGQYYETAFELKDAKTIGVGENETVEVSMMLHSIPEPHYYVVTGQVTDAATSEPLPAVVTFLPVKWVLGGKPDADHDNIDFNFDNKVKTDEKGNYSIKLPDTYTYYANANSIMNSIQYKLQWYEGADSYYEADIIYLDSDKEGVNFKLGQYEATQGAMSGSVSDKEGNVVMSTVIALLKDNNKTEFKAVTRTDEKGNFYFSNLKYGEYVVLSLPVENTFIPGYYVTGDLTTLKWKEATLVGVGDFAPTMMVDIIHAASNKDRAKGIARIKGHLRRIAKGITPGGNAGSSDEEAISGGLVYLTNDANVVVSYFVTDVDGSFELEGLEPGTYTLGIDKFGYEAYSEEVVIDYSEEVELETEIILSQVTTSVDYLDFGTAKLLVSPMPVTNISRVSFDGKAGLSNIKLVDMTGNIVYQTNLNTIDGNNNFDLDAKNVTAGAYILVIENEEKSVAGSITIIK